MLNNAPTGNALAALLRASAKAPKYYELLGRFVTAYARAEIQVHVLARHFSTANDDQARILFHRLGLTKVSEHLRELFQCRPKSAGLFGGADYFQYQEIDACLVQLAHISTKRGDLVHRSSLMVEEGFQVSNIFTAKRLVEYEQSIITDTELKAMTSDCGRIFLLLSAITNPEIAVALEDRTPFEPPTWQYKLPPQAPQKAPQMKARKARKLQRRASRGIPQGDGK